MSLILLHGLMSATGSAPVRRYGGLPDHQLVEVADLIAIVSQSAHDLTDRDLSPDVLADAALNHNAVLTAYAAMHGVLPIRFGAAFSDLAAVRNHLMERMWTDPARAMLQHLKGRQEFGLQIIVNRTPPPPIADSPPTGGKAFLQRRAGQRDARQVLQDRRSDLANRIASTLRAQATSLIVGPHRQDRFCDLAILFDKGETAHLDRIVASFVAEADAVGLVLRQTGPWPAYSFAADLQERVSDDA